jgi:hypothetical protein
MRKNAVKFLMLLFVLYSVSGYGLKLTSVLNEQVAVSSSSSNITPMSDRQYVFIQNPTTSSYSIWIRPGSDTAVIGVGTEIPPGGFWNRNIPSSINVPVIASFLVSPNIEQGK